MSVFVKFCFGIFFVFLKEIAPVLFENKFFSINLKPKVMTLIKRNNGLFPTLWNTVTDENWFQLPDFLATGSSVPAVNILETEDDFKVEMAVPGMKKEDFIIDLERNVLTISAADKVEKEEIEHAGRYTRKEFNYRAFKRSFTLPEIVADEKISAHYNAGVLGITIPKKEEAKPKPPVAIKVK